MLIAHFDDNALLWDKLLKDISNKQKTKKAISGMVNGDRPTLFPRARYIHFLTCTGMSLRKRFFCMMLGAVLCIFRIRCQMFDSFNFFFKLCNHGSYFITKGTIFLSSFCFCCFLCSCLQKSLLRGTSQ